MRCPYCGHEDTQVKDTRSSEEGHAIRRRRFCPNCQARFTTAERIHIRQLYVIKKNGKKVFFNRDKLFKSIEVALRKRPVSMDQIDNIVNITARHFESSGETDIKSEEIGAFVTSQLLALDQVGYIRYLSVYHDFTQSSDFQKVIDHIKEITDNSQRENND